MQSLCCKGATSRINPHIHRVIKARCGPARQDFTPLLSLFDDTLNKVARASQYARRPFAPRFDVKEENESYCLEGEFPGIDQKDVSIEFTDEHTLTTRGRFERHAESGTPPADEVEASEKPAIQESAATPASDNGGVKPHQPTVEDEEAPANASTVAESTQIAPAPAEEPAETEALKSQYWISERSIGQFERSFSFPKEWHPQHRGAKG